VREETTLGELQAGELEAKFKLTLLVTTLSSV